MQGTGERLVQTGLWLFIDSLAYKANFHPLGFSFYRSMSQYHPAVCVGSQRDTLLSDEPPSQICHHHPHCWEKLQWVRGLLDSCQRHTVFSHRPSRLLWHCISVSGRWSCGFSAVEGKAAGAQVSYTGPTPYSHENLNWVTFRSQFGLPDLSGMFSSPSRSERLKILQKGWWESMVGRVGMCRLRYPVLTNKGWRSWPAPACSLWC